LNKRCGAERCGAERCGTERCGTERYGTERYGTERYGTERYGTERYGTERYGTERYGTERYGAERYGTERYGTERYGAERCGAERYGTERYGTERYGTERYGTERYGTERYGTERYGERSLRQTFQLFERLYGVDFAGGEFVQNRGAGIFRRRFGCLVGAVESLVDFVQLVANGGIRNAQYLFHFGQIAAHAQERANKGQLVIRQGRKRPGFEFALHFEMTVRALNFGDHERTAASGTLFKEFEHLYLPEQHCRERVWIVPVLTLHNYKSYTT
jgi:hypothetical protein